VEPGMLVVIQRLVRANDREMLTRFIA